MNTYPRNLLIVLTALLAGMALGTLAGMRLATMPANNPASAATPQLEFAIDGKAIHAAIVQALLCSLATTAPFTRAVDVAAFDDSDAYQLGTESGRPTAFRLDLQHVRTGEFIAYTHVGILPDGVHVLDVSECGGGSGVFRSLLLVRLEDVVQRSLIEGHPSTLILSSVDQIGLGDRNDAGVSVEGDGVVVQGRLEGELAARGAGKDHVVLKLR